MAATGKSRYTLKFEAPGNGKVGTATVHLLDNDGRTVHSDMAKLDDARERDKLARRIPDDVAQKLGMQPDELREDFTERLKKKWYDATDEHRRLREQEEAALAAAARLSAVGIPCRSPRR